MQKRLILVCLGHDFVHRIAFCSSDCTFFSSTTPKARNPRKKNKKKTCTSIIPSVALVAWYHVSLGFHCWVLYPRPATCTSIGVSFCTIILIYCGRSAVKNFRSKRLTVRRAAVVNAFTTLMGGQFYLKLVWGGVLGL